MAWQCENYNPILEYTDKLIYRWKDTYAINFKQPDLENIETNMFIGGYQEFLRLYT